MLTKNSGHYLARKLPESMKAQASLQCVREVRPVRGNLTKGRRPYVQIDRVHYTSDVLSHAGHLIGKNVTVEIDEEDMRQVNVYLANGYSLGTLIASGRWSETKHSRKTRKAINQLLYRRILVLTDTDDPVITYLAYLSTPKKHGKKSKKSFISKRSATEATRVAKEAGLQLELGNEDKKQGNDSIPSFAAEHLRETTSLIGVPAPLAKRILNRR